MRAGLFTKLCQDLIFFETPLNKNPLSQEGPSCKRCYALTPLPQYVVESPFTFMGCSGFEINKTDNFVFAQACVATDSNPFF